MALCEDVLWHCDYLPRKYPTLISGSPIVVLVSKRGCGILKNLSNWLSQNALSSEGAELKDFLL